MKAGRYGKSPFKNPAVPAKNPVAPTPTPSAAKTSGPMQHTEASNAALNPPTESIVTESFGGLSLEGAPRKDTWTSPPCSALNLRSSFLFQAFENRTVIGWLTGPAGLNQALKRSGQGP
jgi:hypothetical protein